jgi:hypothetical protein
MPIGRRSPTTDEPAHDFDAGDLAPWLQKLIREADETRKARGG